MWSISRPDVLRGDYSPVSTTRVDGWPVSITHQHGPLTRVVETGLMYGLIRFSLLGYLCLSWVLWVCSVSTIAKWLAGKSRLWMICYVSSRMLNSSHLPTHFLLIYIYVHRCVCVCSCYVTTPPSDCRCCTWWIIRGSRVTSSLSHYQTVSQARDSPVSHCHSSCSRTSDHCRLATDNITVP